jgi:hypothetical protein
MMIIPVILQKEEQHGATLKMKEMNTTHRISIQLFCMNILYLITDINCTAIPSPR